MSRIDWIGHRLCMILAVLICCWYLYDLFH